MSALILKYGLLLLMGIVIISMPFILPSIFQILRNLAEKIKSEKISMRIKDALDKLYVTLDTLAQAEVSVYRAEVMKALQDGEITKEEVDQIANAVAKKALDILKPETETLRKYFAGEMLVDFVLPMATNYVVNAIKARIAEAGKKTLPVTTPTT